MLFRSFTKAVHVCKSSSDEGYDKPSEMRQKVKLPFKVEQEFVCHANNIKGYELHTFPHPNKKMRRENQYMFVFTVKLVSVVKPPKLKKTKPRKSAFRMVDSDASSDSDDDEHTEQEMHAAAQRVESMDV